MSIDSISNRININTAILRQEDTASHQASYEKASTAKKIILGILTLGCAAIYFAVKENKQEAIAQGTIQSVKNLRHVLENFTPNQDETISLVMNGLLVSIHQRADDNRLIARIDNQDIELEHTAEQLKEKLEDDMAQHVNFYGKDNVLSMLNDLTDNDSTRPRVRQLYSQALISAIGIQEHDLSSITTPLLKLFTEMALKEQFSTKAEFEKLFYPLCNNNLINTADCLDLINRFETEQKADPKTVTAKVSSLPTPSNQTDAQELQQKQAVRNLAADLIYNERTWDIDANADNKGKRLQLALYQNADTISKILKNRSELDALIPEIKEQINNILDTIENIEPFGKDSAEISDALKSDEREIYEEIKHDYDVQNKKVKDLINNLNENQISFLVKTAITLTPLSEFAATEEAIDKEIQHLSENLQRTISEQFDEICGNSAASDAADYDTKTLDELLQTSGTDLNSDGYGRFMREVMNSYFSAIPPIDQRAMIAAGVRYSTENADQGAKLGALLKGAGPIMQKMLQGFNTESMNAIFRNALQDMKSNLAPINPTIIQAYLLDMVEKSQGRIDKIEITKSLGAASVGQALLCKMYTKDHPDGTDCVIKILRPDAKLRAEREKAIFQEAAKNIPGMTTTFAGQLERIMSELDLTIEAANIKDGAIYDQGFATVKSMKLNPLVEPTANTMVLEKAPGITLDRYLSGLDAKIQEAVAPNMQQTDTVEIPDEKFYRETTSKVLEDLNKIYIDVEKKQQFLINLSSKWVSEGIYGEGFYHGDLHAGNMMVDDNMLTVIDFGNATKLTSSQQIQITLIAAAALKQDTSNFLKGYQELLSPEGKIAFAAKKNQVSEIIDKILQKGEESDTGKRIAVALTAIQKLGIEVPAPIFNFSQCQLRLQAAVDSLNEALKQIKDKMLEILPIGAKAMPPYLTLLSTLRSSSDLFKDGVNTVTSKLVMLKSALLTYRETASTDNDSCFLISKFLENIKQDPEDAVTPQAICESSVPDLKEIREQMIELKNSPSADDVSQKEHLFSEYRNKLLQFYESECDRYINLIGSLKHKEPLDFCDCMGEVISQNMRSSLSRLGFFTALRYTYS